VLQLKNKRGYSAQERIEQDIEYAEKIENTADRTLLATKALGAIDFAVEFGLITYTEWKIYIDRVFHIL
jgi:hypothetical protein